MKQSNSKTHKYNRAETAFLYLRLSRDDNMDGESYSISNQKMLLTKIAKEEGYRNLVYYIDDGYTGVTMNRPDFQRMLRDLEEGKAAAVFVKDLSRLGRNYIEVGKLTEEFFPEHDIRFVAISDNVDSEKGENEMTPIKNMFNEWYECVKIEPTILSPLFERDSGFKLSSTATSDYPISQSGTYRKREYTGAVGSPLPSYHASYLPFQTISMSCSP